MTVTQTILNILKERGISQAQFSKDTCIPISTINTWRRRGTNPPSDKLNSIAQYLNVSVSSLLGESTPNIEPQDNPFNNELVWKHYLRLTEKDKLRVQVYILDLAEKSPVSHAEVKVIE